MYNLIISVALLSNRKSLGKRYYIHFFLIPLLGLHYTPFFYNYLTDKTSDRTLEIDKNKFSAVSFLSFFQNQTPADSCQLDRARNSEIYWQILPSFASFRLCFLSTIIYNAYFISNLYLGTHTNTFTLQLLKNIFTTPIECSIGTIRRSILCTELLFSTQETPASTHHILKSTTRQI